MKKVITTVGTSLFTNYMKKEVAEHQEFKKDGNSTTYIPIDRPEGYFWELQDKGFPLEKHYSKEAYREIIDTIRSGWLNKYRPNASAEIKSLLKIAEQEAIEVYLVATQTALSVAACELIQAYLMSEHNELRAQFTRVVFDPATQIIEGLQVNDANLFQETGFINLVDCIVQIKGKDKDKEKENHPTVLNISGGYKALIPPLTLLAQLEGMPLFYIYEDSDIPIETGILPVQFDWSFIELYVRYLNNENQRNKADESIIQILRDKKLVQYNSRKLTILGQLIQRYSNNASPFTSTIFGYFIEYKLHESYAHALGADKVEHSVDVKDGDIDLLITQEDGSIIPVEVKPSNKLKNKDELQGIVTKLAERTKLLLALEPGRHQPAELWLITYSYTDKKTAPKQLSGEEEYNLKAVVDELQRLFTEKEFFTDKIIFRAKHFFITQNKLSQERHIYQVFMKSRLDAQTISDIFVSEKI